MTPVHHDLFNISLAIVVMALVIVSVVVASVVLVGKSRRVVAGIVGVIAVFFAMLVLFFWAQPVEREALANLARPPNPSKAPWFALALKEMLMSVDPSGVVLPDDELVETSPSITTALAWLPEVDETFEASVYPSARSASQALGHQLAQFLEVESDHKHRPDVIRIGASDLPNAELILADVAQILRSKVESVNVLVGSVEGTLTDEATQPDAISIRLDLVAPIESVDNQSGGEHIDRFVRVQMTGAAGTFTRTARYIDKPWVDNYAAFVSSSPSRKWIRAQSTILAPSEEAAQDQALHAAAERFLPLAVTHPRLHRITVAGGGEHQKIKMTRDIAAVLRSRQFTSDKFVQRHSAPYGDVWRVALLLDASPQKISDLAHRIAGRRVVRQKTYVSIGVSVAGWLVVICALYFFLSMATKGYYDWSLRLAIVVIGAGGIALLLMMA